MPRSGAGRALVVALALLLASCSGSAGPTATANTASGGGAGGGGGSGNSAGSGGGAGGGSGDISKVDACKLLTPAEIQQALGHAVGSGINQDSDIVKQCEWDSSDSTISVGVTVRAFDESLWQTIQAFPKASPVSGMGDAAFRNSPLTGDLSVKHDGYEIDMGIPNFSTMTQAQIDQATDSLMKLILSRT